MRHQYVEETKKRSPLRLALGKTYYSLLRYSQWHRFRPFATQESQRQHKQQRQQDQQRQQKQQKKQGHQDNRSHLPYIYAEHRTPLLRRLRDVDMELQLNKIINLNHAVPRLDGMVLHPGETLSYWKAIGKPTARKGYVPGMVLTGGQVSREVGGGLCQLSNLLYWMTLHTPLTVIERHHHGYDVFPDSNRTQPFGSGATCYYPYVDLMIRNDTEQDFELSLRVGEEFLEGAWRTNQTPLYRYEIIERDHEMRAEYWGGFSRHNALYRRVYAFDDRALTSPLDEEFITENHVLMMYTPFLSGQTEDDPRAEEKI